MPCPICLRGASGKMAINRPTTKHEAADSRPARVWQRIGSRPFATAELPKSRNTEVKADRAVNLFLRSIAPDALMRFARSGSRLERWRERCKRFKELPSRPV